ncbi:MAG: DUF1577 domain-containing protein [Leptospiraceae bacterium]|jgi:hypothetical protein|nr:DUF1577 domain-containing protein [Leptospiraceae bacterium]MCZ8346766.1 DUF1577 domain-containing protein [Leptospiraceae bacterium]
MSSIHFQERNKREVDLIKNKQQVFHIINKYLLKKTLTLKQSPFSSKFLIENATESDETILLKSAEPNEFFVDQELSFYIILTKLIHIECSIVEVINSFEIRLKILWISIAKTNRVDNRIPCKPDIAIVSKVIASKTFLDSNLFQIPTLVKVAFDDIGSKLSKENFDHVKINIFDPKLDRKFSIVKKTGKLLFIEDTNLESSYSSNLDDSLNYIEDIDDETKTVILEYQKFKILSELIVPILYEDVFQESFPIGYIHVQSKSRKLNREDILRVKEAAKQCVARIKESNILETKEKFPIVNLSKNGACILINDEILAKSIPRLKNFIFDIYFKSQAPFTVNGKISWIGSISDSSIQVGVSLDAQSDNSGERFRFQKNIDLLSQNKLV